VKGGSSYVEKRASLIHAIMVKRGIVMPEYDELSTPRDNDRQTGSFPINAGPANGE
jgi:hypothetical protein